MTISDHSVVIFSDFISEPAPSRLSFHPVHHYAVSVCHYLTTGQFQHPVLIFYKVLIFSLARVFVQI